MTPRRCTMAKCEVGLCAHVMSGASRWKLGVFDPGRLSDRGHSRSRLAGYRRNCRLLHIYKDAVGRMTRSIRQCDVREQGPSQISSESLPLSNRTERTDCHAMSR